MWKATQGFAVRLDGVLFSLFRAIVLRVDMRAFATACNGFVTSVTLLDLPMRSFS
jgi:hypothetical protein